MEQQTLRSRDTARTEARRKRNWGLFALTVCVCALLALLLAGMLRLISRRTAWVTLPDVRGTGGIHAEPLNSAGDAPSVLAVTPQTVQAAVATLSRPAEYCRALLVTQYWSGGHSSSTVTVTVSGEQTRVDLELPGGQVRHTLTDGVRTCLWYDADSVFYALPAGSITADNEQHIPTYENVLSLPTEAIVSADYREFGGAPCLYAETASGDGYIRRWWVSVDSGLLAAAETLYDGETVYWMETLGDRLPAADAFTLPGE